MNSTTKRWVLASINIVLPRLVFRAVVINIMKFKTIVNTDG